MLPVTISEIIRAVNGVLIIGDPKALVGTPAPIEPNRVATVRAALTESKELQSSPPGISINSRTLSKGDVFFALVGERFDGHDFFNEVIQKGAAACVVSRLPRTLNVYLSNFPSIIKVRDTKRALADFARFYRQKYGTQTQVVGIAGSCGKTTVKEMSAQILKRAGRTVYSLGNFNNEVGCPLSVLSITPQDQYGVFEIGSSGLGEVKRLSAVVLPKVAVITTIQLEHTATFGTLENIAEGESEILSNLSENGWAVLPFDDPFYELLKSKVPPSCRIKSFGLSNKASVYVSKYPSWNGSKRFSLVHQDDEGKKIDEFECTLPVLGKFNLLNACAAAAAALSLNVPIKAIQEGLEFFSPPQMRFQFIKLDNDVVLVNDSYNANPGSMRAALEGFIESFPDKKRCLVLGDMLELGEISRKEHYELGQFIARLPVSKLILYGPQSKSILEGAMDALMDSKTLVHCVDKDLLMSEIQSQVNPGSAILFKASRGMHLEDCVQKIVSTSHNAFHV